MDINGEYLQLLKNFEYVKSGNNSKEESELFTRLDNVIEANKVDNILNYGVANDEDIKKLLSKIDYTIDCYKRAFSDYKVKNSMFSDYRFTELEDKIIRLSELRKRIANYKVPVVDGDIKDIQIIINDCASALAIGNFYLPSFFGKPLLEEDYLNYEVNEGIVDTVYRILSDSEMMSELEEGVQLVKNIEDCCKEFDACLKADDYKDLVYKNASIIIQYNNVVEKLKEQDLRLDELSKKQKELIDVENQIRDLSSGTIKRFLNKEKINSLKQKRDELISIVNLSDKEYSTKLKLNRLFNNDRDYLFDEGFKEIIMTAESDKPLEKSTIENSLENNILSFRSIDDIDNYYKKIDSYRQDVLTRLAKAKGLKELFDYEISDRSKKLINGDYITARNIVDLNKAGKRNGIEPVKALLILQLITFMKRSSIDDINIQEECPIDVINYLNILVVQKLIEYEDEYREIVSKKEENYSK